MLSPQTFFPQLSITNKKIFVIVCLLAVCFVIEVSINVVVDFLFEFVTSLEGVILFTLIGLTYVAGQFVILGFLKFAGKQISSKSQSLASIHRGISIVQYILIINVLYVIFSIWIGHYYFKYSLYVTTFLSQGTTAILLAVFSYKFLTWYKNNKNSKVVILYGLAFLIYAFDLTLLCVYSVNILQEKSLIITPDSKVTFPDLPEGSFFDIFFNIYVYLDMSGFILLLSATGILLKHFARRMSRPKFWLIILLPLLMLVGSSLDSLNLINTDTDVQLFYYYILTSLNSASGGILFGIAFWQVAKTLRKDSPIRTYMLIAAFGSFLLFITNQSSVNVAPYPPYGISALSFLPLASYLIFFGLYSSAISLSQDIQLRQSIRNLASKDANLLSSIGTAQMDQEVRRVVKGMKNVIEDEESKLAEKSGVETPLKQDDMEDYMKTVMEEVARARKPKST
jgi:hypothetical protein